jgi:hypothetical protein
LLKGFVSHNADNPHPIIDHSIGTLSVIVSRPELGEGQRYYPTPTTYEHSFRGRTLDLEDGIEYIMTPSYIAEFLAGEMGMLLSMSYHTALYGAFLYRCVGKIEIGVEGTEKGEWVRFDLGKKLRAFPVGGPVETFRRERDGRWEDFWEEAVRERTARGLDE